VPEQLELEQKVLAKVEEREPALLASNTSGRPIGEIGASLVWPEQFLGLHFFNPVRSMPLIEIVRAERTSDSAIEQACTAAALVGKETSVVRDAPGFATSRLGIALGLEAIRILEDGVAGAVDIDRAMALGYRHPMGPCV
jgi:3-hydroxybutyryl-CoA dehydrogenase